MKDIKKISLKLLTGLLLMAIVISAGCLGDESEDSQSETETSESETQESQTTEQSESEETDDFYLTELLKKGKDLTSVKYDLQMENDAVQMTSKVWATESKSRWESTTQGMTSIVIVDNEKNVMYTYDPDSGTALEFDLSSEESNKEDSAIETVKSLEDFDPKIVGVETIDEKLCTVVEYDVLAEGKTTTTKIWIWQKHGFPIRMEMTGPMGKTIMEMKNIEFGPVDDSMFELPEGVVPGEFDFDMPSGMPEI